MSTCLALPTVLVALALSAPATLGAETARLPYNYLYRAQKTQAELAAAYPDLEIVLRLESALPNVRPADIHATINAKSGKIPLPIGAKGEFRLPMREDLLVEDPWIVTDQPRGTMQLKWKRGLAPRLVHQMTNSIHYATVMRALKESDQAQEKIRQIFGTSPALIASGLKITFVPSEHAVIVIHAQGGDREIRAGADGSAMVPLDPDLLTEDPLMTFSKPVREVELLFRKTAE